MSVGRERENAARPGSARREPSTLSITDTRSGRVPSPRQLQKSRQWPHRLANRHGWTKLEESGFALADGSPRVGRVSLTYTEALARAARISDTTYRIDLDLTSRESFGCRTTVTFDLLDPRATTFLELANAADLRLTVNGAPVESPVYDGTRITLHDLATSNEVVVEARLPYVNDGDGMHTVTDPADDATYVAAYAGMDLAHRVFACFDQPDLKAPITLTVQAPDDWTVVGQRPRWSRATVRDRGHVDASPPRRRSRRTSSRSAPARGTRAPGSTPACRSAGTRARRSPPSSTATSTTCARSPSAASTSTRRPSTSRTRSTPTTR